MNNHIIFNLTQYSLSEKLYILCSNYVLNNPVLNNTIVNN